MLKQSNIIDYLNIFKGDFCFQGLKLPFCYKQPGYQDGTIAVPGQLNLVIEEEHSL